MKDKLGKEISVGDYAYVTRGDVSNDWFYLFGIITNVYPHLPHSRIDHEYDKVYYNLIECDVNKNYLKNMSYTIATSFWEYSNRIIKISS